MGPYGSSTQGQTRSQDPLLRRQDRHLISLWDHDHENTPHAYTFSSYPVPTLMTFLLFYPSTFRLLRLHPILSLDLIASSCATTLFFFFFAFFFFVTTWHKALVATQLGALETFRDGILHRILIWFFFAFRFSVRCK